MKFCKSSGNGASTVTMSPLMGCLKVTLDACRNMRLRRLRKFLVARKVTVLVVAGNRKAEMRQMHADLMGTAGLQLRTQQAEIGPRLLHLEDRMRGLPLRIDRDAALAGLQHVLVQIRPSRFVWHSSICRAPAPDNVCAPGPRAARRAMRSGRCVSSPAATRRRYRGRAGAPVPESAVAGAARATAR